MTNKRLLDTAEKRTNFYIAVIGILLIVIAGILVLVDRHFLVKPLATICGSVGGVLIGTSITGYINLDPLLNVHNSFQNLQEDINKNIGVLLKEQNNFIAELQDGIKISCGNQNNAKNRLKCLAKQKEYYRYFQTLNYEGNWEWRMKTLSFSLSDDGKRVNSSIEYQHNYNTSYSYNIQASYLGTHFILLAEERNEIDNPIVEIYPALTVFGKEHIFSGISIRYPWDRRNKLLITLCILSDHEILKGQWEKLEQGYSVMKGNDTNKDKDIEKIWNDGMKDIQMYLKHL